MRKPFRGRHSLERLYERLTREFSDDIVASRRTSRFTTQGIVRRLYITVEAAFLQGDVTHVTGDTYFLTLLLRKQRTVLTIHDVLSLIRLKGFRGWVFKLLWYRLPMSRARIITVVSAATRDRLVEHGLADGHDIRVIHNCLFDGYEPHPKTFNSTMPTVLLIGTAWNKNVPRVLAALEGMRCKVRIIGEPSRDLEQACARHGLDYSIGSKLGDEEILREYLDCDMVVLASTEEGFGLPIIEAQAVGRPVVTSNCSSMPEVAGDGAELVDPTDIASIRAGIERVIADHGHRAKLIERGFENVGRFRPGRIAAQYEAIYRELAR